MSSGGSPQQGNFSLVEPRIGATTFGGCALAADDSVLCWGGEEQETPWLVPSETAKSVALPFLSSVCVAFRAGGFECFAAPPVDVFSFSVPAEPFISVRASPLSVAAIDSTGQMLAWSLPEGVPMQVPEGQMRETFVFDAGICGVRVEDGRGVCVDTRPPIEGTCGEQSDVFGQLEPPDVALKQVAAGRVHACAIAEDDTLVCWGAGTAGQLEPCFSFPFDLGQNAPPEGTFTHVASGFAHSCAVRTDTTVACWGAGTTVGDCVDLLECGQSSPPSDSGFTQVAAGLTHSCGLKLDGTVVCWGSNTSGRSTPPPELEP